MSRHCSAVLLQVHREIVMLLAELGKGKEAHSHLLDIGCWKGDATVEYVTRLRCTAHAVEVFATPAAIARQRGIDVAVIDLETQRFPWGDGTMDVVIANQVFEHLKNVWLPMSEIVRVLRLGGLLVLSVPNLGSLHNRLLLALGRQPTSIRTLGPHIRGFTFREIRRLVELGDCLVTVKAFGVGFYPFPYPLSRLFTRIWPAASHTTVVLARKERIAATSPWLEYVTNEEKTGLQTFYDKTAD